MLKNRCKNCKNYVGNNICGAEYYKLLLDREHTMPNTLIINPNGNCSYYKSNLFERIKRKLLKLK